MNPLIKKAYDLGVQEALRDYGLVDPSEKVASEVILERRDFKPDNLGLHDAAIRSAMLGGIATPALGGFAGAGLGAGIGHLIDKYRGEDGYFGDDGAAKAGVAIGGLLGALGAAKGGYGLAGDLGEGDLLEARVQKGVFPGQLAITPVANKRSLSQSFAKGLDYGSLAAGGLAGAGLGGGIGYLIDKGRGEEGSSGDRIGTATGLLLGGLLGGAAGYNAGKANTDDILKDETKRVRMTLHPELFRA